MNRLVRIAFTLFASATILVLLVQQRLRAAKESLGNASNLNDELSGYLADEQRMATLGLALAGLFLVIGLVLLVVAFRRSRQARLDPSRHG